MQFLIIRWVYILIDQTHTQPIAVPNRHRDDIAIVQRLVKNSNCRRWEGVVGRRVADLQSPDVKMNREKMVALEATGYPQKFYHSN